MCSNEKEMSPADPQDSGKRNYLNLPTSPHKNPEHCFVSANAGDLSMQPLRFYIIYLLNFY